MQFWRSVLGSTGAKTDIPYNVGEAYGSAWGSWVHHQGSAKDTGDPVSVFTLTGANAQDAHLTAARNGAKRLRTVRHPNVLSFLHSAEVEKEEGGVVKPTIYVVTEPVMPLSEKIKELSLEGTQRDEYFAWGLHQIAKAVSFLNNDCKLVHGNICVASVVVTPTLDWKLHAFDVLSEFDGANPSAEGPMLQYEWLVGAPYKPLEVSKGDWTAVRKGPPHAIDSWGLGCLIQELFSASKLARTEELRNTAPIPKTLLPDYQKLLGSQPNRRMNPSRLIDNGEFFQNKLVDTIQFMEVLNLKDSVEKDAFFRKLPALAEQLPRQIVLKKLLPQLASSLEFGAAPAPALNSLLKLGAWLPAEEFNAKILPTVIKLFASTDRAIRVGLLQNIESFGAALSPTVVDEQIFNHVATGFSDNSAFLRELTLKSMLVFANKLSQRTLTGNLLKHLSKLQVDEEAAIRTNTTILLGNIARHLNDSTRKRVLINAFTVRALRDTFPPARSAGIMALMATKDYYDIMELGTRILPNLVLLTVDPDPDVRAKAFQGSEEFLQTVKNYFAKIQSADPSGNSIAVAPPPPSSASSAGLLGWAVSSLTSKGTSSSPSLSSSSAPPPPLTSTVSAPAASVAALVSAASTSPQPLPENQADLPTAATPASSDNGWENAEEMVNGEGEDDKDGWDDLDEPPAPPPALSRIQAAQKRPVTAAPPRVIPKVSSSSQLSVGSNASEASGNGWGAEEEEEDPWAAIAAPKPVSVGRTVSSGRGGGTGASPALGGGGRGLGGAGAGAAATRVAGHVRLPAAVNSVSLEDMLGSSMEGGGGRGRGTARGRGRAAPAKLGAQRIGK